MQIDGAPDEILHGGRVLTMAGNGECREAIAWRGDRIVAVGDSDEVLGSAGPRTRVVDLDGACVIPGINDAHLHLAMWAIGRPPFQVDLRRATSLDDVRDGVARGVREQNDSAWVIGSGWHGADVAELRDGLAVHREHLDAVSAGRPVYLWHRSLHAAWVNSEALRRAGITAATPDPPGGTIVRDAQGEPTGHLLEGATELVVALVPEPSAQTWRRALVDGMRELNARGVTSVTDPMVTPDLLAHYQELHRASELTLRLGMMLHWTRPGPANNVATLERALDAVGPLCGIGDDWWRIDGVKLFADGVPPLRTSWMRTPYADGACGGLVTAAPDDAARLDELDAMIELLHRRRWRMGVHVTGDRANDAVVDALVRVMETDPWPARHHVIHASFLSAQAARRLAPHDVTISTNSLIKWQATDALESVLGAELNAYHHPVRTLVEAGLRVADASDAPITDPDWRRGVQTLVVRDVRGSGRVSGPDECVDLETALRAWTVEGAYQGKREDRLGSLVPGRLADLVVLAEDPRDVDPRRLHALTVRRTVVAGRSVHEA